MTDLITYISEPTPELAIDAYYQAQEDAWNESQLCDGPTLEEDELAEQVAERVQEADRQAEAARQAYAAQQAQLARQTQAARQVPAQAATSTSSDEDWSGSDEQAAMEIANLSSPYDADFERVLERVEDKAMKRFC